MMDNEALHSHTAVTMADTDSDEEMGIVYLMCLSQFLRN